MKHIVDASIEDYCTQHSSPPSEHCRKIEEHTRKNIDMSQMLVGPLEGSFLGFLVSLTQAKRILEIGCFTGYSALCMAERLPENGELMTLDINETNQNLAKTFWKKSPHGSKIKPILGNALESLTRLSGPFDLVFIDADKTNYLNYFEKTWALLSPNGLIVFDNCLWGGQVLKSDGDEATRAIQLLNDTIAQRSDLEKILLPLRDGVLLVRKNKGVAMC